MESSLHCHDRHEVIASKLPEWRAFADRCRLAAPFCGSGVWGAWLRERPRTVPALYERRVGGELRALLGMERIGARLTTACALRGDYQDLAALERAACSIRAAAPAGDLALPR